MPKHKTYSHQSMSLAKLRLKGQYSPEEIDDAETELLGNLFIVLCRQWMTAGHEDCFRLRRAEGLISVSR